MRDKSDFYSILSAINGEEYGEYEKLVGDFDFSRYVLKICDVQVSPDDEPTLFIVRIPQIIASFPPQLFDTAIKRMALEDFLVRKLSAEVDRLAAYDRHGISRRRIWTARPGQKILPRSSMIVTEDYLEARLYVDLPSQEGTIPGDTIIDIFFDDLPRVMTASLYYCNLDEQRINETVGLMEDADSIRKALPTRGLVSFAAEGSFLKRDEGTDEPDFESMQPVTIKEEDRLEIDVPNAGSLTGIGVPAGLTLVLGDDYHGRRDLMEAIGAGIYNHVCSDGRELVITVPDAVSIAADPGRSVQRVDMNLFLESSPNGSALDEYREPCADAFVAQAAATMEALEAGARVLIYDESWSSPAFIGGDSRLDGLLPAGGRDSVPLLCRARQLVDELGVSLIIGGAATLAEYLPLADNVLRVHDGEIANVTADARTAAGDIADCSKPMEALQDRLDRSRLIVPSSIDASSGRHDAVIDAMDADCLRFGRMTVDLSGVRQLADIHQTVTIGQIIYYAKLRYMDQPRRLVDLLDLIDRDLSTEGLEFLSRDLRGDLARPRRYEVAAAINRMPLLRINPEHSAPDVS